MKNLSELLNYKTFSASAMGLGVVFIGFGVYNLTAKDNVDGKSFGIGFGSIILALSAGYYLGREDQKEFNENTYQTKPEDYQNK